MVKMTMQYTGEKHCQVQHEPSRSTLETDAPRDNNGKGEKFSPTDLVGTALGTCMLTTVAIFAEKEGVSVTGSKATVTKEMSSNPRRISKLSVLLEFPEDIDINYRNKIKTWAENCPVKISLSSQIEILIQFSFNL